MEYRSEDQKLYFKRMCPHYGLHKNYLKIQKDLEPCPICGAGSRLIFPFKNTKAGNKIEIKCSVCGAYVTADNVFEAISDWNDQFAVSCNDKIIEYRATYINDDSMEYLYVNVNNPICGHQINGKNNLCYMEGD